MSDSRFNPFGDDLRDRHNIIRYLLRNFNSINSKSLDTSIILEIDKILEELDLLEQFLNKNSEFPESKYSDEFLDRIIPIWEYFLELDKSEDKPMWGTWRTDETRKYLHGYSDYHTKTLIRKKSATSQAFYSQIPDEVIWKCIPITQKGMTFYIVSTTVSELNAVCSVPSFDKTVKTSEAGLRVLDRSRKTRQWQRNPNPDRIAAISTFIGDSRNIIANSPLVFASPSEHVSYLRNNKGIIDSVKINFSFLIKKSTEFTDHNKLNDLRPLWLIDGQHRVRGISQNPISEDLDIAFIFFPDEFGVNAAAKIFAEVNTLARDLSDLHKMFMRHRFELSSVESGNDFRPYQSGRPEEKNSRKNSLTYECAAYLTSKIGSPMRGLIQILDENIEDNHIIDSKMFVKNARHWFSEDSCYPLDTELTKDQIFLEVTNYFKAVESVVNHHIPSGPKEWGDGEERWLRVPPTGKNSKNTLQNTRCFRSILHLYPHVVRMCSGEDRPINHESFEKILLPISWVDWNDPDLWDAYCKKTGEMYWKYLLDWLINAVENRISYELDEVMSTELPSLPGKGILSPPDTPEIYIEKDSPTWPTPGNPVYIISKRPINSYYSSTWNIRDSSGSPRMGNKRKKHSAGIDGSCRFEVKYSAWMDSIQKVGEEMTVFVDWSNANGDSGAKIVLKNQN